LGAGKEAANNAAQFLRDADILGRTRSFRHACGLIALAEEEMAKALILSVCASGILAHRGWFKLAFEKHSDKHVTMSIVAIVARLKRLYRGTVPSRQPSSKKASGVALMKFRGFRGHITYLVPKPPRSTSKCNKA